jgi:hypothetical protein
LFITPKDVVSSDGFQINHYRYSEATFENFWISDDSAGELLKVGVLTHIQLKGTWAHFKTADNTTFSVKTLQAEKWPYEKILSVLETHKKTKTAVAATFPKELFEAIDRASSFYLDISDTKAVRLLISPKHILVSAERIAGKFEEKVAWKDECPQFAAFELYVDINMILFAARRSMAFYIYESEDNAPRIIFTTENSTHLMATLSIDEEKTESKKQPEKAEPEAKKEKLAKKPETKPEKKSGKKKAAPPDDEGAEDEEEDVDLDIEAENYKHGGD